MYKTTIPASRLTSVFRRQYELCNVKSGESIAFLTDLTSNQEIVAAGLSAAAEIGNAAYEIRVAQGPSVETMGESPFSSPGLIEALCKADLVITFFTGFFSPWERAIRTAGGRILNLLDTPDQLVRLQGSPKLKAVVVAARDMVRKAAEVRVTSAAGTDFTWVKDSAAPVFHHYGAADERGSMDHWGQGMVGMFPRDGSANGRVVVKPGDVWILPYARIVQSRIEIEVRDGFIRDVSGAVDAKMFSYWLDSCRKSPDDLDPYAISHLGWGLNPKARWDDIVRYENSMENLQAAMRSYPGSFLFSTGPGPARKTKGHIDMPMNDCTISLDGEVVVKDGRLIHPGMIVDPDRTYH